MTCNYFRKVTKAKSELPKTVFVFKSSFTRTSSKISSWLEHKTCLVILARSLVSFVFYSFPLCCGISHPYVRSPQRWGHSSFYKIINPPVYLKSLKQKKIQWSNNFRHVNEKTGRHLSFRELGYQDCCHSTTKCCDKTLSPQNVSLRRWTRLRNHKSSDKRFNLCQQQFARRSWLHSNTFRISFKISSYSSSFWHAAQLKLQGTWERLSQTHNKSQERKEKGL